MLGGVFFPRIWPIFHQVERDNLGAGNTGSLPSHKYLLLTGINQFTES